MKTWNKIDFVINILVILTVIFIGILAIKFNQDILCIKQ